MLDSHGVGQSRAIADHPAIDEDRHVFAQSRLVIEHVAARLRIVRENRFKNVPYGAAGGFGFGQCHVPLDVGREDDLGHGSRSLGRGKSWRDGTPPARDARACCGYPRLFWGLLATPW